MTHHNRLLNNPVFVETRTQYCALTLVDSDVYIAPRRSADHLCTLFFRTISPFSDKKKHYRKKTQTSLQDQLKQIRTIATYQFNVK